MTLKAKFFQVEIDGPVAHLKMNRPQKANGMSPDFWDELPRLTRQLEQDMAVRVMVISGNGKHFTGGMDLTSFGSITSLLNEEPGRAAYALRNLILKLQDSFNALADARFPVVAAIHGACIGSGVDLISACDLRLATADAQFSIEEINIGMCADVGTLQRLPKLIAPGIVKELAFTGRKFTAGEAKDWGLVNQICVNRQALLTEAISLAHQIAAKSPLAIAGVKKAVNYATDHTIADSLDQIATWNGGMLRGEDLMGAVQAKMQNKETVFADLMKA